MQLLDLRIDRVPGLREWRTRVWASGDGRLGLRQSFPAVKYSRDEVQVLADALNDWLDSTDPAR